MRYEAVLFDFDYTLGDATASIYEGSCVAFEEMGLPKPDLQAVRNTIGHILEDEFTMITGETDPARRSQFRERYQKQVQGRQAGLTVLFPGAAELLTALRGGGVGVGIVTSKRHSTLNEILARFGLTDVVDFAVGGEDVAAPKPDPEGLNAGIAALGADKGRVLYCGDTTIDAETAKNAGVDFCAVLNGTTGASAFEDFPYVHIAPDLVELRAWLGI